MIGRGSYGNPWIFKEMSESFSKNDKYKISTSLKKDIILEHFSNSLNHYGEEVGIKSFRKHLGWYMGYGDVLSEVRQSILTENSPKIVLSKLKTVFDHREAA